MTEDRPAPSARLPVAPGRGGDSRRSRVDFPKDAIERSIPARFERIVAAYPHDLAVKVGTQSWTYDMLNRRANRVAHGVLERHGPAPEPVLVFLEQGVSLILGL